MRIRTRENGKKRLGDDVGQRRTICVTPVGNPRHTTFELVYDDSYAAFREAVEVGAAAR
jgi:hypothetical protein